MKRFMMSLFFLLGISPVFAIQYFVSPSGNDANDGLTTATPFQTLSKVNTLSLLPGDQVSLEGGTTFVGYLIIQNSGALGNPITISSYGGSSAIIAFDNLGTGKVKGLEIKNASHIQVQGLIIVGDYVASNDGTEVSASANAGLDVYAETMDVFNVSINNVEVSNFKWGGIRFKSNPGFSVNESTINNCLAHDNGFVGISTRDSVNNILITHSISHHNTGWSASAAGSGIHLSGAHNTTIQFCIAHHNAGNNGAQGVGGGGGIWASNSTDILFQYNESHHNETMWADGCAFDIDGGVINAIVQYNYAHDNYGAGFLIFQYNDAATKNVTLRYNISENDGTWGKQGAIHVHRRSNLLTDTEDLYIYNNTVYNSDSNVPMVELNKGSGMQTIINANVHNNLFVQPNGGLEFKLVNGATVTSDNNHRDPIEGNSMLTDPGNGGTVDNPLMLSNLDAYKLSSNSPLLNQGLDLTQESISGLTDMGSFDFYGNSIPQSGSFDIGAHEFFNCIESELLIDNNFDIQNNTIPNWNVSASAGTNLTYGVNATDEAYFDILNGGGTNYNLQMWQDNLSIDLDEYYKIKINLRAESTRTLRLIVRKRTQAYFYLDHTFEVSAMTEEYSFGFRAPLDDSDIRLSIQMGGDNHNVYIDDITFIKDCDGILDPCLDYLSLLHNDIIEGTVVDASVQIMSNGQVQSNSSVFFSAGESIELTEGFETASGAIFEANIEDCD